MSSRDYVKVAAVIAGKRDRYNAHVRVLESQPIGDAERGLLAQWGFAIMATDALAESLADVFAADNPRFDRARFLKASGQPFADFADSMEGQR